MVIPWLAISGCVAQEPGLDGTWQLTSIDSSPIEATPDERLAHFTITGTAIEGYDGCNQFSGPIDRPDAITSTRRACPDAKNMLPLNMNELDTHLKSAEIEGDVLKVPAQGDYSASTYLRQPT